MEGYKVKLRKLSVILFLILGFLLNVAYTFWIVPLGKNDTFLLEAKCSREDPQTFIHSDSQEYITIAINLKEGKGFVYPFENPHPTAYRMPGYPLFLSWIFSLFGARISIALLFQCLLLVGLFGISYFLARMFFSKVVALASLGIMVLWPNLKFYGCAYLGSETLAALLFYAFLFCVLKGGEAGSSLRWLCVGILFFGGAIYSRPDFLLFVPFFIIWLVRHYHARWCAVFFMLIMLIAMLAPWTIRNFYVFNRFIPATTGVGAVLDGCYNPKTVKDNPGGWNYEDSGEAQILGDEKNAKGEVHLNDLRMRRGLEYMRKLRISQLGRLIFWKTARLWFPVQRLVRTEAGIVNLKVILSDLNGILSKPFYLINIFLTMLFLPIYILFWIRLIRSFKNFRSNELLLYFFLYINLIAILFWGSLRFRFVFEPIIIIFGCSLLFKHKKEVTQK